MRNKISAISSCPLWFAFLLRSKTLTTKDTKAHTKDTKEFVVSYCGELNYFNYFTEIEEHFQRRRGTTLLLSTLDWALIETWKDAGIPLEAVLRGIDIAFEKFQKRPSVFKKVNSLAYCSQ